jgi:hypothetical protein
MAMNFAADHKAYIPVSIGQDNKTSGKVIRNYYKNLLSNALTLAGYFIF